MKAHARNPVESKCPWPYSTEPCEVLVITYSASSRSLANLQNLKKY